MIVVVKRLAWSTRDETSIWARTAIGDYRIYWARNGDPGFYLNAPNETYGTFPTIEAAKLGAQEQHDEMILSELET